MIRAAFTLLALAAPAHAGSLPQVPGVVLDDHYYGSKGKLSAPEPRPDLICWRNTKRAEWRWAFAAPAPWWGAAPSGAGCGLSAPGNTNERPPGFVVTPAPTPRRFVDPNPSDRSRCDGVWRPIATCD